MSGAIFAMERLAPVWEAAKKEAADGGSRVAGSVPRVNASPLEQFETHYYQVKVSMQTSVREAAAAAARAPGLVIASCAAMSVASSVWRRIVALWDKWRVQRPW